MSFFTKKIDYHDARFSLHERLAFEKDEKGKTKLVEFPDLSQYPWDTPTVFCLGGIDATSDRNANGFAKVAHQWLGDELIEKMGVRLFVEKYPPEYFNAARHALLDTKTAQNESEDNPRRILGKALAKQLVDGIFKPRIDAAMLQGKEEAKAMLAKSFSNITFLGYSIGSYILPHVHDALKQALIDKEFTIEETSQLMRNIHVLGTAETGLWRGHPREGWDFASVHMASSKDSIVSKKLDLDSGAEHFITLKDKPHTGLILTTLENPSTLERIARKHGDWASHSAETYTSIRPFVKIDPHENGEKIENAAEGKTLIDIDKAITGEGAGGLFVPALQAAIMRNMVTRKSNESALSLLVGQDAGNAKPALSTSSYYRTRLADSLQQPAKQIVLDAWPDDWSVIKNTINPPVMAR